MLERLPLNANGKLDRRALPAPEYTAAEETYVAPRTAVEEVVAGIWAEVLRLERVGVAESFFELGGHSLLATRMVSRIREVFGVELPLRALFESPSVAGLAGRVEALRRAGIPVLPPVAPTARTGTLPLSFAQERLWFIDRMQPGTATYNLPVALRLRGSLHVGALKRALAEIVRRHEALRTVFGEVDGSPEQVVAPSGGFALPVADLSGLAAQTCEAEARRRVSEEVGRPFDLAAGPLFRAALLRLGAEEHALLLCMHHIVSDGWSLGVLFRELSALYAAYRDGQESPLPELAVQYVDYAAWQRRHLQGEALERQLAYWRDRLADAPALLELPADHPRPPVQSFRGASARMELAAGALERLRALGRQEGATLFMVVLGAFQLLLSRYAGSEDIVVGSPIAGRTRKEVEELIGFFVNTLVLRSDLSGDPSFREVVGRVREATLGAYEHQELPFERLVAELQPERSLSRSPLFQVTFTLQDGDEARAGLPGLETQGAGAELASTKYDLMLGVTTHPHGLRCELTYSTELFEPGTVERMLRHLARVLEQVAEDAEVRLSGIELMGAEERRLIVEEWNRTGAELPAERCIHQLFEEQAERTPDAVAVVFEGEALSYAELNARANRLAHALRRRGAGPEVRVGICLERSLEMVVSILGVLKAGGAYVPLDPAYPAERLAFLLEDAAVPVLLSEARLEARLPPHAASVLRLDAEGASLAAEPEHAPQSGATPRNQAYVLYTSGSTGRPKGVVVEHRGVLNLLRDFQGRAPLRPGDRCSVWTSPGFDVSVYEIFSPLLAGASLYVPTEELRLQGRAYLEWLAEQQIRGAYLPPFLLPEYRQWVEDHAGRAYMGRLLVGVEPISESLLVGIQQSVPGLQVINGYGPTEATICSTLYDVPDRVGQERTAPIGRPVANTRAYVLDGSGRLCPVGVPGELYLGGVQLARGYLGRAERTAERFVPDPYSGEAGARLYRTGDRVRWLGEGVLEFRGRVDQQVKVRGFRIEPGEIESVLVEDPAIREAVVVAREGASGLPDDRRLVGYVSAAGDTMPSAMELREQLSRRLPEYMVPSAIIVVDALPRTPSGKVDLRSLPEPGPTALEGHPAPGTPTEEVVSAIFEEVLGTGRVGAHDNFFERGGHSLLATRVVSRVAASFGAELPLRAVFEAQTVAELAARIDAARREGEGVVLPPLVAVDRSGPLPLSFAQERLWFLHQMDPQGAGYNMPFPSRVAGLLDVGALQRALGALVRRHESLRTTFRPVDGGAVQVVCDVPAAPAHVPLADLSGLAPEAREREARRLAAEDGERPFDLRYGPLLRLSLLRLRDDEHVMLLCMHHIVSDGWSMGVLFRELYAPYTASSRGEPPRLPPLGVQYGDFAVWQRGWLAGDVLRHQLDWWRERLAGSPP
ncbi:MAG TPA: amino acid adenylation domain-containing protein, partial [Longimicrobiaceae bacterium]|nr:amino acid adenylation domain-containing protein [Longimicrobiaceae bacterium]